MRSVLLHFSPVAVSIAICASIVGCGCASTSPATQTEMPSPLAVAESWRQALIEGDIQSALALVDDAFSSPTWPNRADLTEYLAEAGRRGYFERAVALADSPAETAAAQGKRVYPVSLRASMGTAVFGLTLRQSEHEWKIISADLEVY